LANNIRAGGEVKPTMGIRNLNLRMSQIRKRGNDWFGPVFNVQTPLSPQSPTSFYVPFFNSAALTHHKLCLCE